MALWIRSRPPERCHEAEIDVAEMLAKLPDDWVVRWGFHYRDPSGVAREGDFLVLGPKGGLLVIEVKSGSLSMNPYTGQWSTADGDDPRDQLHAEWKGVLAEIRNARPDRARLFVGRALGVPDLTLGADVEHQSGSTGNSSSTAGTPPTDSLICPQRPVPLFFSSVQPRLTTEL